LEVLRDYARNCLQKFNTIRIYNKKLAGCKRHSTILPGSATSCFTGETCLTLQDRSWVPRRFLSLSFFFVRKASVLRFCYPPNMHARGFLFVARVPLQQNRLSRTQIDNVGRLRCSRLRFQYPKPANAFRTVRSANPHKTVGKDAKITGLRAERTHAWYLLQKGFYSLIPVHGSWMRA